MAEVGAELVAAPRDCVQQQQQQTMLDTACMDIDGELDDLMNAFSEGNDEGGNVAKAIMDDYSERGCRVEGAVMKDGWASVDADAVRRRSQLNTTPMNPSIGFYKRHIQKPPQVRKGNKKTTTKPPAVKPVSSLGSVTKEVDTLKKFQSRAFKAARKKARDAGKSEGKVTEAGKAAYKQATEEWKASH